MTHRRAASRAVPAIIAGLALAGPSGCVSVMSTAVSMAGIAAHQERGIGGRLGDLRISAAVREALYNRNHEYAADIGVTVYDRHVVLTGLVPSAAERDAVERLARSAADVAGVTNEIAVLDPHAVDPVRDAVITSKLEARLLLDHDVDAVNYSVTTVNRTVYVIGVARDRRELERVLAHARDLEHVRHVVPHVRLKAARDTVLGES